MKSVTRMGGLPDLQARRVRFIGDAGARIQRRLPAVACGFSDFMPGTAIRSTGMDAESLAAIASESGLG